MMDEQSESAAERPLDPPRETPPETQREAPPAATTEMVHVAPACGAALEARARRLAHLPFELAEPIDPRLVMLDAPDSRRAESFRVLRDSLVAKTLPRILAVTSVNRGEGKTTCAANLALALAERSASDVLLVDGNLLEPSLGSLFGIDAKTPAPWWSNPPILAPYKIIEVKPRFFVATIVLEPGQRLPRLDPRWFDLVVGHLASSICDHVIIDTPALECAPAVRQVVTTAHGALVVVKSGVTTAPALREAVSELGESRTVGITLMDA